MISWIWADLPSKFFRDAWIGSHAERSLPLLQWKSMISAPRSLLFQVYRILDELLLAGEVSETSTSKIIAIMKSVDKMDWCTDGCSVPGTIPVRWVEADNKSSLNVNDPFLIYNFYVHIHIFYHIEILPHSCLHSLSADYLLWLL